MICNVCVVLELHSLVIQLAHRIDLGAELITGFSRRDLILVRVGEFARHGLPIAGRGLLVLPDDLIVLTENRRIVRLHTFQTGDLAGVDRQRIGPAVMVCAESPFASLMVSVP